MSTKPPARKPAERMTILTNFPVEASVEGEINILAVPTLKVTPGRYLDKPTGIGRLVSHYRTYIPEKREVEYKKYYSDRKIDWESSQLKNINPGAEPGNLSVLIFDKKEEFFKLVEFQKNDPRTQRVISGFDYRSDIGSGTDKPSDKKYSAESKEQSDKPKTEIGSSEVGGSANMGSVNTVAQTPRESIADDCLAGFMTAARRLANKIEFGMGPTRLSYADDDDDY